MCPPFRRYDLLHNPHLNLVGLDEIFAVAKALADGVIPNEYGINPVHKLRIGSKVQALDSRQCCTYSTASGSSASLS
jgi:hypothetical protein